MQIIYIKKVTRSLGAFRKYLNITKLKRGLYNSHTTLYGRPASHAFLIYIICISGLLLSFYILKSTCSLGAFRKYLNITKLKRGLYNSHTTLYGRPASHAFLIYIICISGLLLSFYIYIIYISGLLFISNYSIINF